MTLGEWRSAHNPSRAAAGLRPVALRCAQCFRHVAACLSPRGQRYVRHVSPECGTGESERHRLLKKAMAAAVVEESSDIRVAIEAPRGTGRADLLVTCPEYPRGAQLEAETKKHSLSDLVARTRQYKEWSDLVVWVSGNQDLIPAAPALFLPHLPVAVAVLEEGDRMVRTLVRSNPRARPEVRRFALSAFVKQVCAGRLVFEDGAFQRLVQPVDVPQPAGLRGLMNLVKGWILPPWGRA